ncbi:MAG TPA: hypothetical protein VHQ64_10115 [Pyrinomonadaceae bacterium]|nr:hypothetical protein [Pyrinomonadaceae bacterium]
MDDRRRVRIKPAGPKIVFNKFISNRREINKRQAVLTKTRGNCDEPAAKRRQQDDCVRKTVLFGEFCELLQVILLGPMLTILAFVYLKGRPRRTLVTLLFVASFGAVFSLLPLRNYAVTGQLSVPVLHYTSERIEWSLQTNTPVTTTLILARGCRAALFCEANSFLRGTYHHPWLAGLLPEVALAIHLVRSGRLSRARG